MPFPTFLGVGAMKCGTTTLFVYLQRHPDVFVPAIKEVNWFLHRLSLDEYMALFPDCAVRGEISPGYLYHIDTLAGYDPGIKLILCVREPITRFVSTMRHFYAHHPNESIDVTEILNSYDAGEGPWQIVLYKSVIEQILAHGFPFHLINFDDLVRDQQTVFDRLADFLGVPRLVTDYIHVHSSEGRPEAVLTADQVHRLRRIHAPCVEFLRQDYGIEFIEKYEITET